MCWSYLVLGSIPFFSTTIYFGNESFLNWSLECQAVQICKFLSPGEVDVSGEKDESKNMFGPTYSSQLSFDLCVYRKEYVTDLDTLNFVNHLATLV